MVRVSRRPAAGGGGGSGNENEWKVEREICGNDGRELGKWNRRRSSLPAIFGQRYLRNFEIKI